MLLWIINPEEIGLIVRDKVLMCLPHLVSSYYLVIITTSTVICTTLLEPGSDIINDETDEL